MKKPRTYLRWAWAARCTAVPGHTRYICRSGSGWDSKHHVVFIPKRGSKVLFGKTRRHSGEIFHALVLQRESQILDGHLMPDHVHMCVAIPRGTR